MFNCIGCGTCEEVCSIFLATRKDGGQDKLKIIELLKQGKEISQEQITTIFNCTKCEACQTFCNQEIPLIELYDWARHEIVRKYGLRNKKQEILISNIIEKGNPFGNKGSRLENIPKETAPPKIVHETDTGKGILVHMGCMLGYRLSSMRDDLLRIFNLLDVNYSLLENEQCCGYFIFNTGDHESAQHVINKNSSVFANFNSIICACAGCYTFFREKYPKPEKFVHAVQFIHTQLERFPTLNQGSEGVDSSKKVTFHDSCHLTRPHGIIHEPREILNAIGTQLTELDYCAEGGLCCGADGGMRITNPQLAVEIGKGRVNEAHRKNVNTMITLCPFCVFNFEDACAREDTKPLQIESLYRKIRLFLEKSMK